MTGVQTCALPIFERNGIRIALLGYDEFQPRNFEADHDRAGIAWSEDAQVVRDITLARTQWRADVVILIMHWGWEEATANPRQRALARRMIDAGADAVIGGHPHQVQDTDVYNTYADVSALENLTGYHPQTTISEGLDRFLGWLVKPQ